MQEQPLIAKIGRKRTTMTHELLHWEETLQKAGHRVTRQRTLIMDAVCAGDGHTPLGEIYHRVRQAERSIDRSTVYRALHLFVELGLVVAADTGGGETYYEITKIEPHHHLVCRRCGDEREVSGATLQAMFDQVQREHRFHVRTDHLVLFGLCETCQSQMV
jgi:Fur family ferric uptake transcriptional regulator